LEKKNYDILSRLPLIRAINSIPTMHAKLALTVKEAARALGVGERAVRGWIARGELPAFNIGPHKGTRISVRAVEKFMEQRTFNQIEKEQ
jgi:excisionase family DNA binding protein